MEILFYFFNNSSWNQLIHSAKPLDNKKNTNILCQYLSEIDIAFAQNVFNILDKYDSESDISSQSWGCEISNNIIKIFFILDDENLDFTAFIEKNIFIKILKLWLDFLMLSPKPSYQLKVEIAE